MGQSTVVAAAFSVIMFVAGLHLLMNASNQGFESLSQVLSQETDNLLEATTQRVGFTGWRRLNSTDLLLNVSNTGEAGFPIRDLEYFTLLATYNDSTKWTTTHVGYRAGGDSWWRVEEVYYKGAQGDLLNPVDPEEGTGIWDPGEVLEIRVHILGSQGFDRVSLSTPSGFTATTTLTLEEEGGSFILGAGQSSTWVEHHLGRTPQAIVVTGTLETDKYWVSAWNSTHFQLTVKKPKNYDVRFFWYAR